MWDDLLKFLNENKDALGWLFGSGVILAVLGGIYKFVVWLIKENRLRRIRTNENFPFKIITPNDNVAKEILGGADDDPLADRNIPYQQRIQGRNTRRELEELIEDHRWILIAGRTGLGKTREAVQLAQSLNNEGWTILYLTREAWLDAPAKLPNDVPERKLLFFLDDLNKKCYSSKAEIRPDASKSLTLPINEPFQIRLERTLAAFDTFCGKSEIRVIATARNEKTPEFDEPSEWDKLGWTIHKELWQKFKLIELEEPDKVAEQQVLRETAEKATIKISADELLLLAKRNDGTFRNLVENLHSAKLEGFELSTENFRDTLKGTWQKRYQKAVQKYPDAKYIYDSVELSRDIGLRFHFSTILRVAEIIAGGNMFERTKSRRKFAFTLEQLIKNENILYPKDGQIEAKGYKVKIEDYLNKLYFEIGKEFISKRTILDKLEFYAEMLITPKSFFLYDNLTFLKRVYGIFSLVATALTNSGYAYLDFEFPVQALSFFRRSLELRKWGIEYLFVLFNHSYRASPWIGLGIGYHKLRQYDDAIGAYRKAIELYSKHPMPWDYLGDVYRDIGRYEDAIEAYKKAIQLDPKRAFLWTDLGKVYRDLERHDDAIQAYQKAIELDPKRAFPWDYLGNVYDDLNRYDDAIQAYQKAIELDPKRAFAWDGLGYVYKNLGRYDEAIQAYQKAIELDPKQAAAWYGLGTIYNTMRAFDKALYAQQKAVEIFPDSGMYRASLLSTLKRLGLAAEAEENENIARSLIDNENEYNRACFESICGNTEEALLLLKVALDKKQASISWAQKDPDFDFIRDDPRFKKLVGLE